MSRILILLTAIISMLAIVAGCNGQQSSEKNEYDVKVSFHRKTIPEASSELQTLTFSTTDNYAARTDKVDMSISDIDVSVEKTQGTQIPPFTAFVSQTYFRKNNDLLTNSNGFAGNMEWLKNRVGEIAICTESVWLEHGPTSFGYNNSDSTINIALVDNLSGPLHPVYRESGSSYLAHINHNDQYIPWVHPDVPAGPITLNSVNSDQMHLDMSTLTTLLFTSLSGAVTSAITGLPTFSWDVGGLVQIPLVNATVGGPLGNGDFKLHYIPQLQYNEGGNVGNNNNQVIRSPGLGFYFEATIDLRDAPTGALSLATIKIIIPAIVSFTLTDASGNLQVEIQPIADLGRGIGTASTGLDKIVVLASTPLGVQSSNSAETIRNAIVTSLTGLAADGGALGLFISSTIALSSGFNKYKSNKQLERTEFDAVIVPTNCGFQHDNPMCFQYNGFVSTQVQPVTPTSTLIAAFIMRKYR